MTARDASIWIGIALSFVGVGSTWGVLSERTSNTIKVVAAHTHDIESLKTDSHLSDKIQQLELAVERMRAEQHALRNEVSEMRSDLKHVRTNSQ